jgi:hypothetical protein
LGNFKINLYALQPWAPALHAAAAGP